jgi:glycosyltransferase involved in cell wall biosynthesis
MSQLSVLLATEGTFPFYGGGVSTWCDRLTHGLSETEFTIFAVTTDPFSATRYPLAKNVTGIIRAPQWGHTQPAEHQALSLTQFLRRRSRTTPAAIRQIFQPRFEEFLCLVTASTSSAEELGDVLLSLHLFFLTHDYSVTMNSDIAWMIFQHATRATWEERPAATGNPTYSESKQAFRLLYHLLTVLATPVPQTHITHSSAAAFCGIPCVLAKLLRGTPYLLTEHGVYIREQYLNLRGQISSLFVRWFLFRLCGAVSRLNYHFADQVSPVCAYNARWEREFGVDPTKIAVIFNGVCPEKFQPQPIAPKERPQLSTVGLIYPLKGQADLIKAAAIVRRAVPDLEVRIYGAATDEAYFNQCQQLVVRHHLENNVTFCGLTKSPWQVYSDADLVVLPSISEGFPYVVVEAMMCGASIVASDVGGVREALGPTGVLTPSRNPKVLAQAMDYLLHNSHVRSKLGASALVRALELFTEKRFLRNYERTYWNLFMGMRPRMSQLQA